MIRRIICLKILIAILGAHIGLGLNSLLQWILCNEWTYLPFDWSYLFTLTVMALLGLCIAVVQELYWMHKTRSMLEMHYK